MFTAIVALVLATPAEAPKQKELPEAAQKELKALESKWKITKILASGEEQENVIDMLLEFKGRKILLDGKELLEITTLDPGTDPKCMDFKVLDGDMGFTKGTKFEAIYKLDGDNLSLAVYIGTGNKRPDKFESAKESGVVFATLKREKK